MVFVAPLAHGLDYHGRGWCGYEDHQESDAHCHDGRITYDVTFFPHADDAEVEYQLKQLAHDLEIAPEVIRDVCSDEIAEYLKLDAQRDASAPVHSIVEVYVGGTAFAWYGINDYPRLKRVILRKLAQGGQKAKRAFVLRASKAQVDMVEDY